MLFRSVEEQDAFYDQVHHQEWIYAAELAIVILLLIGPLLLGGAATLLYHLRKYNPDVYPEKYYPPAQRASCSSTISAHTVWQPSQGTFSGFHGVLGYFNPVPTVGSSKIAKMGTYGGPEGELGSVTMNMRGGTDE